MVNGGEAQAGDGGKAARYDRLIAAFGEDPFGAGEGVCARVEDASAAVADASDEQHKQQLLTAATQKSVRCAELIASALEASATLSRMQKTLHKAYEAGDEEDESMASDEEEDEDDEKATLLLQDLVAASDDMADAGKQYARLGVVEKTARASRELLLSAERELQTHAASNSTISEEVQSEFRDLYMEEFTSAFGDELNAFRQEERFESKDVTYLISCIHAGGDIFSPLQKKLFVESVGASRVS